MLGENGRIIRSIVLQNKLSSAFGKSSCVQTLRIPNARGKLGLELNHEFELVFHLISKSLSG